MTVTVQEALRRIKRIQEVAANVRSIVPFGWETVFMQFVDDFVAEIVQQCGTATMEELVRDHGSESLNVASERAFAVLIAYGQKVTPSKQRLLPVPVRSHRRKRY